MSEKRYGIHDCPNGFYYLSDVTDHSVYFNRNYGYLYSPYKYDIELVSTLLNELADKVDEQQTIIDQLNFTIDDLLSHTGCEEIQKENEMLTEENEQLHHELQQTKEYLQTKIDECKNHEKMKEIVFGVEELVGYEKALLQIQKGIEKRIGKYD